MNVLITKQKVAKAVSTGILVPKKKDNLFVVELGNGNCVFRFGNKTTKKYKNVYDIPFNELVNNVFYSFERLRTSEKDVGIYIY